MTPLPCIHIAALPTPKVKHGLIDVTVSHDGHAAALVLDSALDYRKGRDGMFAKLLAGRRNRYRIVSDLAGSGGEIRVDSLRDNVHQLRRLPDGNWLLVRSRATGADDDNAIVVSAGGEVVRRFHIGDGVGDVQVTPRGDIWVGFFDAGVFAEGTAGAAGLGAFRITGESSFDFNRRPPAASAGADLLGPEPFICDCYAFHAASDREVWLCPYTDFPVIRMIDGRLDAVWPNPGVTGSHAMFGFGDRVLLAGSYDEPDALMLCDLGEKRPPPMRRRPVDQAGCEILWQRAFPAGRSMYLQTERDLYRVDLSVMCRPY